MSAIEDIKKKKDIKELVLKKSQSNKGGRDVEKQFKILREY
jgi:hypothetical protein